MRETREARQKLSLFRIRPSDMLPLDIFQSFTHRFPLSFPPIIHPWNGPISLTYNQRFFVSTSLSSRETFPQGRCRVKFVRDFTTRTMGIFSRPLPQSLSCSDRFMYAQYTIQRLHKEPGEWSNRIEHAMDDNVELVNLLAQRLAV